MKRSSVQVALTAAVLVVAASVAVAQAKESDKAKEEQAAPKGSDSYDQLLAQYLLAARATAPAPGVTNSSWMMGLLGDLRARNVNDLVTIQVVESVSALGSADSSLDKSSSASASVTNLFGIEGKLPDWLDPTSLASASANTDFKGGGSTTRTATLSAVLTARVAEVMPNGDLALEGVRELDINGDRQILVLTGIVRAADVGPGNVVPSTRIGQMRIRYFGRGLIKDNLSPGLLVRILNKIF